MIHMFASDPQCAPYCGVAAGTGGRDTGPIAEVKVDHRGDDVRIASAEMLSNGLVASPEMLPVKAHATRGVGGRDPRPLFSSRR